MATKTKLGIDINAAVGHAARKAARKAGAVHRIAKANAKADAAMHDDEHDEQADAGDTGASVARGFAGEVQRVAQGVLRPDGSRPSAPKRYEALGQMLVLAELMGENKVSFADANKRTGYKRGETGRGAGADNAASQWSRGLSRLGRFDEVATRWRVDADARTLVRKG